MPVPAPSPSPGPGRHAPRVPDPAAVSLWLQTADDDLTPRPPLVLDTRADVAILGAGFTGLWTAYYLLQRRPDLKVVVLEEQVAGFGASGRNGGWCSAGFALAPRTVARRFGPAAAVALHRAMAASVDEVLRVAAVEGIPAGGRKGGVLRIARGAAQLPALHRALADAEALGIGEGRRLLDAEETRARVRISGAVASLFSPDCAVLHPGRLVRGLARAVERRGGVIHEQTPVSEVRAGPGAELVTPRAVVRADHVVLAGEAYLTRLRGWHRQLIPAYSLIVATEPLDPGRWEAIGWEGREALASTRLSIDYLCRTADGRICFGGRGAPYHLGSRIEARYDHHPPTHAMLRRMAQEWFPELAGVRFTHAWGGPLGVSRDWTPTMTLDPATGIASARGYAGQGVATANLAGRVLTDLLTGADSDLVRLPMVGHHSPDWEPEPWRWLGVRYTQWGLAQADRRAQRSGRAPTGRTLAERMGAH
ncbi:MAG TPA: FAD-binding oxidoreductase [Verrucomicrobiae bacterium]|nr:FAD-binding oxidoreductase [Verrucomicrobiae bacterium]